MEDEISATELSMDDLPASAIVKILSFLSFTELSEIVPYLSQKWKQALDEPIVWLNKKYIARYLFSEAGVLTILRRVPQLRSLELDCLLSDTILNAVCENCSWLEHLTLEDSQTISYSMLNKLVRNCQNIKWITIPDDLLVDQRNAQVLAQLPRLQTLHLIDNITHEKPIHLGPLDHGCPELSELQMVTKDHLLTEDLKRFLEGKCRKLTRLSLPRTDRNGRCIIPLLKDCTSLVSLELHEDSNKIGEVIEACRALKHLSKLRSLCLCFNDDKDPAGAVAVNFAHLSHLQQLEINGLYLQYSVLLAVCVGCPNLTALQLSYCRGLNDGDLRELYRLQKLETLTLYYCFDLHGEALLHVSRVPNLRKLSIVGCDFRNMKNSLSFLLDIHTLEMLSFANCRYTRHFNFECIPEMLPNLRDLTVRDCEVDPRTMEELRQQMPHLRLNLTDSRYDFDRIVIKLKMIGVITLLLVSGYYCLIL